MPKKLLIGFLCLFLLPLGLMAQTGKIAGKVVDRETGEPLIGANVIIVGTSLGDATDLDGNFVILNVPIGKHVLKASYVGYKDITIKNVLVSSNRTTDVNFRLPSEAFKVEEVVIVRKRPLVEKNVTNSTTTKTQEDIENMPVRGVEGVIATSAGIVRQNGQIYVRGGRSDEVQYLVDGVNVNNPLFGGRSVSVINNAIGEINFQAGGYSAEFGGGNAGIISTTIRTGGQKFNVSGEFFTDSWGTPGEKTMGTYPYGISTYVLTAGGPLVGPVKFFIAGQNSFNRTPVRYWEGFNMTQYYDPIRQTPAWQNLPDAVKYQRGDDGNFLPDPSGKYKYLPKDGIFDPRLGASADFIDIVYPAGKILNAAGESYVVNGNITADLNPINIRLGANYGYGTSRGGVGITTFFAEKRASLSQNENLAANLKFTHLLSKNTFYELNLNYFFTRNISMDPDFKHDLASYGDSLANAQIGYPNFRADGLGPNPMYGFGYVWSTYGTPLSAYSKSKYQSIGAKLAVTHQLGREHEFRLGGEFTSYVIRNYANGRVIPLAGALRNSPDITDRQLQVTNRINNYGYDLWGNAIDSGPEGPKKPVFAAFFIQDKIEYEDIVINAGLRYDYINTDDRAFKNPHYIEFDSDGNIREDQFVDVEASQTVSPRLGFSFPVTDQTVFYAQYGKFVQQSRLRDIYLGSSLVADNIQGGYAIGAPVGFGLRPERTTQYDIGFRQQIGDNLAFDISAFYKDIRGQIQQRQITTDPGAPHQAYYAWVNGDFSTTVGMELKIDLRRTERLQANVNYTFSDARGTGSSPSTAFRMIWQSPTRVPFFPQYATSLAFDQTHRGTFNLDYRFGVDDGPKMGSIYPLERLGLNILFTYNSGHPYTRVDDKSFRNRRQPIEELNASRTPWNFQLDLRLDKTVTVGPLDLNFYIWIINVLNTKNVEDVFITSGVADDNGYLTSEEGQADIANYAPYGDVYTSLFKDLYYQLNIANANLFGPPRQVRFGLRFDF